MKNGHCDIIFWSFPGGTSVKEPTCQCREHETHVQSLSQKDPLEDGMATHLSIFAWRIPWTEKPGGQESYRQLSTHNLLGKSTISLGFIIWPNVICLGNSNSKDQNRTLTFLYGLPRNLLTEEVEGNPPHFYILAENRKGLMPLVMERKTGIFQSPKEKAIYSLKIK